MTFGPDSPAPYLSQTLAVARPVAHPVPRHRARQSRQLHRHDQRPGSELRSRSRTARTTPDFVPSDPVIDSNGQAVGQGCVFPATVPNLADQLGAAGHTWRAYLDDMGSPCRHPDAGRQRRHAVGEGRRPVRRSTQPVRVLPFGHRRRSAPARPRRRPRGAPRRPLCRQRDHRTSCSSRRTCATTATTSPASTANRAVSPRPTPSSRSGSPDPGVRRLRPGRPAGDHLRRGRAG